MARKPQSIAAVDAAIANRWLTPGVAAQIRENPDEATGYEMWLRACTRLRTVEDFDDQIARERAASAAISALEAAGTATPENVQAALDAVEDADDDTGHESYDHLQGHRPAHMSDDDYARMRRDQFSWAAEEAAQSRTARRWAAERAWLDEQLLVVERLRKAYKQAKLSSTRGAILYRYNRLRLLLRAIYGADMLPEAQTRRAR